MTDEKVYTATVIENTSFPEEGEELTTVSEKSNSETYSTEKIKATSFPQKRVAVELLSTVLNTKTKKILGEFQFTQMGAIQIGKYENGVSGDLRLSPTGVTGRNTSGTTTLAFDAETGSAIFAGEVRSGSTVTGEVVVGDNDIILTGGSSGVVGLLMYNNNIPEILIGRPE